MAALRAARTIKSRLVGLAARLYQVERAGITFSGGQVHTGRRSVPLAELARLAFAERVSLSSTGFYATPKTHLGPGYRHRATLPVLRLRGSLCGGHGRHRYRRNAC